MLKVTQFPIYQKLDDEFKGYGRMMLKDLKAAGISISSNMDYHDISYAHSDNVNVVKHPDASKHYVVIKARMNMLSFAYDDLVQDKSTQKQFLEKVQEVEYLEKRDAIQRAERYAKNLAQDDKMAMVKANTSKSTTK